MKIAEIFKTRMSFSFEVFPPKEDDRIPKLQHELDELCTFSPDFITCTYGAGGTNVGKSLEICDYITKQGVDCMTHYTCVGASKEKILSDIKEYINIGLENILTLRGDFPKDPDTGAFMTSTGGAFDHANELIAFIKEQFPDLCLACAGAPETHILAASRESDIAFIRAKQDAGAEFVMCQLCHDVDAYARWVEKCRKAGIRIPFVMGLMPVLSRDPIINMTLSNGCSLPSELAAIIGKYTAPKGAQEALVKSYAADFKKAGMEYTAKTLLRYMNCDLQGIHLYALNKSADVGQILLNAGIRTKKE
ncbi:MAG: methylenetetrahydrofolate reductase [Spirochaetaceae bacterium]|jgi:methylenetetrahydrofolate reductase (NADPH)|nr:methylenetetrahydrofolate reductase [Spirochaetaceae bacterium]